MLAITSYSILAVHSMTNIFFVSHVLLFVVIISKAYPFIFKKILFEKQFVKSINSTKNKIKIIGE